MAILNICGFETGLESTTADVAGEGGFSGSAALTSANASMVTSPVRTGTYALRSNCTTTASGAMRLAGHAAAGGKATYSAATVWAESVTGNSNVWLRLRSGSTDSNTTATEWVTTYRLHAKLLETDPNGDVAIRPGSRPGRDASAFSRKTGIGDV